MTVSKQTKHRQCMVELGGLEGERRKTTFISSKILNVHRTQSIFQLVSSAKVGGFDRGEANDNSRTHMDDEQR